MSPADLAAEVNPFAAEDAEEIELALGRAIRHAGKVVPLESESGAAVLARKAELKELRNAGEFGDSRMMQAVLAKEMARKVDVLAAERQTLQLRRAAAAASQGLGVHLAPADSAALGFLANEVHGMSQGSARVVAALQLSLAQFNMNILSEMLRAARAHGQLIDARAVGVAERELLHAQGALDVLTAPAHAMTRFGVPSAPLLAAMLPPSAEPPALGRLEDLERRARAWLTSSPCARAGVEVGALLGVSHALGDPEILPPHAVHSVMRSGQAEGADSLLAAAATAARKRIAAAAVEVRVKLLEHVPEAAEAASLGDVGLWARAAEAAHAGLARCRQEMLRREAEAAAQLQGIAQLHGAAAAAAAAAEQAAGEHGAAHDGTLGAARLHWKQDLVPFLLQRPTYRPLRVRAVRTL